MAKGSLNELARECHADNQHWWHDPKTGKWLDRNRDELLMLVVSEIAEAMEGERKSLRDDHIKHRWMAEVELADAMIRIADIAGADSLDLDGCEAFAWENERIPDNKAAALLGIVSEIVWAAECRAYATDQYTEHLRCAVDMIYKYAEKHGYDLDGAIAEKRAYNATRADHKPENRIKPNGKAF